MQDRLPIEHLVEARRGELGLTRGQLLGRVYADPGKGVRRLGELCDGDLVAARGLLERLPQALELPAAAVEEAVRETAARLDEAARLRAEQKEAAWRAAFRPHAIVIAENRIPRPIFAANLIGLDRLLRIAVDPSAGESARIELAKAGLRRKLDEWGGRGVLPAFGRPVGFVLNHTPDRAVCCDLDGMILAELSRAYRIGDVTMRIGGTSVPVDRLRKSGALGEPDGTSELR